MLTSSVLRTPVLLRLAKSVGWLRSRLGGGQRAFFVVGLVVVACSIVGMHQLSLNHELATPTSSSAAAAVAADAGHQHGDVHDQMAVHPTGPAVASVGDAALPGQQGSMAAPAPNGSSGAHQQGCPGCGSHTMAFGACLLALTLLVLYWRLAPAQVRLLPPRAPARLVTVLARVARRIPALSLSELSILRT